MYHVHDDYRNKEEMIKKYESGINSNGNQLKNKRQLQGAVSSLSAIASDAVSGIKIFLGNISNLISSIIEDIDLG